MDIEKFKKSIQRYRTLLSKYHDNMTVDLMLLSYCNGYYQLSKELNEEVKSNIDVDLILEEMNELQYTIFCRSEKMNIDLNKCKEGDILISSHGAKLEYIAPTPWKHLTYLDHVVRYIEDVRGNSFGDKCYGTRTNEGFTYRKNRKPAIDHDIVEIQTKIRTK